MGKTILPPKKKVEKKRKKEKKAAEKQKEKKVATVQRLMKPKHCRYNADQFAKSLIAELAPSSAQNTWRFKRKRIQVARLATCYNYKHS